MPSHVSSCWTRLLVLLALCLVGLPAMAAEEAPLVARETVSLSGTFWIVWGDPPAAGADPAPFVYQLATPAAAVTLLLDDSASLPAGGPLALNRRGVRVVGRWEEGAFRVEAIALASAGAPDEPAGLVGSQPWVSIMCKFKDYPSEPRDLAYFEGMYADLYPGLDHYWRQVSYQNIDLVGSDAVGWYYLPQPRSYYVYDNDGDGDLDLDWGRAVDDCTLVADPDVYFPDFVGINLMFNADLDCCAWGGSWYVNRDGQNRLYRVTWEPPWGYGNIGVIAHETGHGFGMPHSSGDYGQVYDNRWDVMSDIWTDCGNLTDPTYGCVGQGTIAYHHDLEGWIPGEHRAWIGTGSGQTLTLEQLIFLPAEGYLAALVPIDNSRTDYYTVEARKKASYDVKLPAEGVIIHHVVEGRPEPAHVVDIDRDGNTGDAYFGVGQSFIDAAAGITVTVDAVSPRGWTVTIANRFDARPPIHVQGIKMRAQPYGSRFLLWGVVRIADADGRPVAGASVAALWTLPDGTQSSGQSVSGPTGLAAFRFGATQAGTYELCVTAVAQDGMRYDPAANIETCDTLALP
ncbi:MAG TPA: hypothetical protein PKO09_16895 [Anaerolineae bacterium]|nr:hypothetical protein [Anaerolineae bacterium]